ncbi:GNAT family N-acetyltransferase [Thalassolituus pacificus]|uniref:GNAT family N-acetyltransferase n=1 Tax=Thalassolituus pacificus TaxID=2975440 RepID=A0A9X3ARI9_9GAMM|nr:GNAT family protein [Thalassolituus pacificus]MCT7357843.1 GNAT family N-acetyltransferase [Thalassolituus pacificus]
MSQFVNDLGQPVGEPLTDWVEPAHPSPGPMDGRFCRLEPLAPERHAEELYAANAMDKDGRNWTYLPYGPFGSFERYYEWLQAMSRNDDPLFFTIIQKSDGRAVGIASYLRIMPASGSIEVGHIHFSEHLKRSPVATEAMFLMMKRAFELGYRRYEWKCDALNAPSCAAAQRLGFSHEGTFRQATVYKRRSRDTAWFSVIDIEWPALSKAFSQWLGPDNFDELGEQRARLSELTQAARHHRS